MTSRWVGEYEIVKRLCVGGMATLYLARRHGAAGFSRLVALKVIHPHLVAQPSFIDMFVDEARICSRITHPNVVHVEEFGEVDGIHYLVMEYLDGCSVAELLRMFRREGRRLDPELAARIIMQIASGLHAAHETVDQDGQPLDIVHRDISPSNILLSTDGHAKLIDFGIAKARNRLSETEGGTALKGKYKYIAPEQATRSTIDRRSDIFSLGVVFWEMLVGRPLFVEDTHVALFNRLHRTEVSPPSTLNPDVIVSLDLIVLAMLQHDPVHRPQSGAEVQRRITTALPGAANREASELGALAIEVRDKRAARRAAADNSPDNDPSLSPTSRSSMRARSEDYHIEIEAMPNPRPHTTAPTLPTAPHPWSRRAIQVGIAGLLGIGLMVGILLGRQSGAQDTPRRSHPASVATKPSDSPPPAAPERPPLPTTALSAVQPATAPPAVAQPPAAPAAAAVPPPQVTPLPTTEPDAIAGDTPEVAEPATTRTPAPAAMTKREPPRTVVKPRPIRRGPPARDAAAEVETAKAPSRGVTIRSGDAPIADMPFDEPENTGVVPAAPNRTKVKKTPIVTDFGN